MESKARATVQSLIEKATDPEQIEMLGKLKAEIAEDEAYGTSLENRVSKQSEALKNAILNAPLPSNSATKQEESGGIAKPISEKEAIASLKF